MKIAFLTSEYPHPRIGVSGGIGTSIMNLTKGIVAQGHEVVILAYAQEKDEVFEDGGITFYRIKNWHFPGLTWLLMSKKISGVINKLYSEKKIDLVEAPDWTGISCFIRTKCPIVVRLHGSDTYFCHLDKRPVKWLTKSHEKRALERADALLSVSQFTADVTNELFALGRKFTVIPNCIDSQKFDYEEDQAINNSKILYFGTLVRKKGLLELPHIFNEVVKKNPSAQLVLVGRDTSDAVSGNPSTWEMMKPLFSEAARHNVRYLGSVGYHEIKSHISDAEICVFPTFAEALPVSWIEAMAVGKPVVASNIGWAKEVIVAGESGFLVHPENHSAYADKILALLENGALRKNIGYAARERAVATFDIKVVASQNITFYKSVIKK